MGKSNRGGFEMRNSEKIELKRDIKDLSQKGYSQREAIKILINYGYCESTARSYWKVFSVKYGEDLK